MGYTEYFFPRRNQKSPDCLASVFSHHMAGIAWPLDGHGPATAATRGSGKSYSTCCEEKEKSLTIIAKSSVPDEADPDTLVRVFAITAASTPQTIPHCIPVFAP